MSPEVILYAIGAAATYLAGRRTSKRDRDTTRKQAQIEAGKLELDGRRADGEAYERAQRINQEIVDGLRQEHASLLATIGELRRDLLNAQQYSAHLENQVRDLESTAATMGELLRRAGIDYPPAAHAQATKEV